MIKVTNLNKTYYKGKVNELHVVNNVSLTLPDVGLVTLLGSSGSGKTTLLNVIGGLDKAKGEIQIDDFEMKKYQMDYYDKYRKKNIGYIFQNYNLLYGETVYDNLRIALEIINVTDKEEQRKRIEYCLNAVGMFNYRKKTANSLSGGQQQRVSIARALVKQSKVIIADEPTGNLDSKNSIDVMNILKSLSKTTLILLVTHNKKLAYKYSDHIYGIQDGKIQLDYDRTVINEDIVDDSIIDLSKMKHINNSCNNLNIEVYFKDKIPDSNIKIIYHDNHFYFDGDERVKSLNDSSVQVVDTSVEIEEVKPIEFDDSFYQDKKQKKTFKDFISYIKDLINSSFRGNKLKKVFNISLFLIGIFLAFSMIMLTVSNSKDETDKIFNRTYDTVINEEKIVTTKSVLKEALASDSIKNVISPIDTTLTYFDTINFTRGIAFSLDYKLIPYQENHVEIAAGNAPSKSSVLVSETFLSTLNQNYKIDYELEKFIGSDITIEVMSKQYTLKISGITKNDKGIVYVSSDFYYSLCFTSDLSKIKFCKNYKYEVKSNGEKTYRIVSGRDVNPYELEGRTEALVNADDYSELPNYVEVNNTRYMVVGSYKYEVNLEEESYITNLYQTPNRTNDIGYADDSLYVITEGRKCNSNDEIIVSNLLAAPIGSEFYGYTVVGKFTGSGQAVKYSYISTIDSAICETFDDMYIYDITDLSTLNTILSLRKAISSNWYDSLFTENKTGVVFIIISAVLLALSGIFIFFIVKSMIIDEKNEIVVYRALGKSRKGVFGKSLAKIITLSILTCFVGYVLMICIYQMLVMLLSQSFDAFASMVTLKYILSGAGLLFLIVLIFGSIPYISLLRRTPIEILGNYDI